MNYWFHAGAEQDITDAQDFYEQHAGLQVATRFLDELQHVIELLLQHILVWGLPPQKTAESSRSKPFPIRWFTAHRASNCAS